MWQARVVYILQQNLLGWMLSWEHNYECLQGLEKDVTTTDQELAEEHVHLERCSTATETETHEARFERFCTIQIKRQALMEHYRLQLDECNRAVALIGDSVGQCIVLDVASRLNKEQHKRLLVYSLRGVGYRP